MEGGWLPDRVIQLGIRSLLRARLRHERTATVAERQHRLQQWIEELKRSPIAVAPEKANEQHYELPPEFFGWMLGPQLKYSSAYWPEGVTDLAEAEEAMVRLTCQRADIRDGQTILDLGCGWGSLTRWLARAYPKSTIVGVSNSHAQREWIAAQCATEGLANVEIRTADVNRLEFERRFDRVVSVEMFEHVRNYERLLERISQWLTPQGKLFVHIFCHRELAYPFETEGAGNWMGRYFFSGGQMPAANLLLSFQRDLVVEAQWRVDGTHYARTLWSWLRRLDRNRAAVLPILARTYGEANALVWFRRWRVFLIACAELFGFAAGKEWFVAHYLFGKR